MTGEVIFRHAEPVMGTVVSLDVRPQGLAAEQTRTAITDACRVLHHADDVFSLYRADTPLSRLRRGELGLDECPPQIAEVHAICRQARSLSEGWFDPWAMPGGFDPTGLVKGWAAREAADVLRNAGVGAAMVNAAGDIALFGRPASGRGWHIGVRSPEHPDDLMCVLETDDAVATSGRYERGDHVLDVRSGRPATQITSATVCGPDLALADAFATALVAAGEAGIAAVQRAGYEALIVPTDQPLIQTEGVPLAA